MGDELKKIKIIREFRVQLVRFLDELIEQFPQEGDLIFIRIFIKDQIPMADVLGRYIRDILPYRSEVDQRNEQFFLQHSVLYNHISTSKVDHFRQLWTSDLLDDQDRRTIWEWMDVFNTIASNYYQTFGAVPGWEEKEN